MPKSQQSWVHPSVLRHSGIWGAADEAVLNNVHKKLKNAAHIDQTYIQLGVGGNDAALNMVIIIDKLNSSHVKQISYYTV